MGLCCLFSCRQRTSDVDHAQQSKDQSLNKAGEQVEVAAQKSGDAEGQDGNAGEDSHSFQQTEEAQNAAQNCHDEGQLLFYRKEAENLPWN